MQLISCISFLFSKMSHNYQKLTLSLFIFAFILANSFATHICGHYCGPNWCNNQVLSEANCDDSVQPETWSFTGASCADSCCKAHDTCCGHGVRATCNTEIVNCLSQCDPASVTCTLDGVPVPAGGIWAAMDMVESWCCGSPCTAAEIAEMKALNITV